MFAHTEIAQRPDRTGARRQRRGAGRAPRTAVGAFATVVLGATASSLPVNAQDADPVALPIITVSSEPAQIDLGPCSPGRTGLSYETINTPDAFTLRIIAATAPCAPVAAVAAAYRMPDDVAWPQTLEERRDLVIADAGVTIVRFSKGCDPLQFDVITGATPTMIAPWAEWHGPLLFPDDINTAWQHRPSATCVRSTTTTTSTTTTSAPTSPTSPTSPTTVDTTTSTSDTSTTTTVPDDQGSTTVTTEPPAVLAATQTRPSTAPAALNTSAGRSSGPEVAGLALTGAPGRVLILGGLLSIVAGLLLLATQRRGLPG